MPAAGRWLLLIHFAALSLGCASLPEYARPVVLTDPGILKKEDVIDYRPLTRADFKATEPPVGFDHRIAAAICAYIEPTEQSDAARIVFLGQKNDRYLYSVSYDDPKFRARMDRDCSWWNRTIEGDLPGAYILEHEQVHFALFETAAREWSEEIGFIRFEIGGADPESLQRDLQSQIDDYLQDRMEALRRRNLEFDEQTSAVYDPDRQREWLTMLQDSLSRQAAANPACGIGAATRDALAEAKRVLREHHYRPSMLALIAEAEAAAAPPECDQVRAGILVDKVLAMGENPAATPCRVDAATRQLFEVTLAEHENPAQETTAQSLILEARASLEPPDCDPIRARILLDKARELIRGGEAGNG